MPLPAPSSRERFQGCQCRQALPQSCTSSLNALNITHCQVGAAFSLMLSRGMGAATSKVGPCSSFSNSSSGSGMQSQAQLAKPCPSRKPAQRYRCSLLDLLFRPVLNQRRPVLWRLRNSAGGPIG